MTPVVSKLGVLTKIRTGKLDANASSEDGEYPFFTCAKQPLRISSYSYDCECVLVAGNGDLNVKYYEGKFDAYQRTYILETLPEKKSELHLRYVYHFMEKYLEKLREQSIGGIIKYIKLGNLTDAKIPLPPLEEQKRIAGILDAADILRAKRREALAKLDDLLQSTFLDMFGDPVTNPKGWEVPTLGDICTKITDGTHHSPPVTEDGIPYITAKHLKIDGLKFFENPWFVSKEDHEQIYSRCDPKPGDVLYIKDGATTGIAAINRYDFPFSMLSSLALIRPDTEVFLAEFLCAFLNNERNKMHLLENMGGAAIKRLTLTKIKKFKVPLPPLDLQRRFAEIVSSVEEQKAKMRKHLEQLDDLFASLQQRAFRGDL